jgi:integrase/recombinase XerD
MTALTPTLQAFFTERLIHQRQASAHTIAAYRDTLRLLLAYVAGHSGIPPCRLDLADLDAPVIARFLDHLQTERGNSARTRNARLAAIHSLFRYAALQHPEHAASISRVLAIPPKRYDHALVTYSPRSRSTPCWPPATRPPGPGDVTTPCYCSLPKRAYGSPS